MKTGIEVVCHDYRCAITGCLRRVSDRGCEVVSGLHSSSPAFPRRCRVLLNLLDTGSGKSMNVFGRLSGVIRDDGNWVYRIQWQELPALLREESDKKEEAA